MPKYAENESLRGFDLSLRLRSFCPKKATGCRKTILYFFGIPAKNPTFLYEILDKSGFFCYAVCVSNETLLEDEPLEKLNETYFSQLSEMFLLREIPKEELRLLLLSDGCRPGTYRAGEEITSPCQFDRALYIIVKGGARVCKQVGERKILLRELSEGSVFGAASLFGGDSTYVTTVTAKSDTETVLLTQALCTRIIREYPAAAIAYITFLSDRIRFLNARIDAFTAGGAERRLAKYLLENGGSGTVTMKNLASALDVSRATLYRALDHFTERGLIYRKSGAIAVTDARGLAILLETDKPEEL